jgi:hypothetical protein
VNLCPGFFNWRHSSRFNLKQIELNYELHGSSVIQSKTDPKNRLDIT